MLGDRGIHKVIHSNRIILVAIALSIFFWLLESALHSYVFHFGDFASQIFPPDPDEIWMRVLIVFLFVILGAYTQSIINRLKQAEEGLRASEKELRHLSSRLLEIQEAERKRIAMELHDDLAKILAAIKVGLEARRMTMEKDSAPPGITWDEIVSTTQRGIEKVRRVIMELRPTILDDLGILAAIEWFCREYQAIYRVSLSRKKST